MRVNAIAKIYLKAISKFHKVSTGHLQGFVCFWWKLWTKSAVRCHANASVSIKCKCQTYFSANKYWQQQYLEKAYSAEYPTVALHSSHLSVLVSFQTDLLQQNSNTKTWTSTMNHAVRIILCKWKVYVQEDCQS